MQTNGSGQRRTHFGRRHILILMGLSIGVLGVYGVLGAVMMSQHQVPAPQVQIAATSDSSLKLSAAHQQAQALATGWQADAQVIGVASSWRLASGEQLTLHRPAWSFSFYSPAAQQVQVVTVNQTGAEATRQTLVRSALPAVQADWNVDSSELLFTFMAYGGEEFIKGHSLVNIHVQLRQQDDGRSVWYMTAIDPELRQSLTVGIDALSRQVIVQG